MKKTILTIGLITSSLMVNSQIVIKESAKDSVVWYSKLTGLPKLVNFYSSEESNYTLYYKNAQYQHITDIKYLSLGERETAKEFFSIVKNVIETGEKISIEMDGKLIIISKSFNTAYVYEKSSSFMISNKQIENILKSI